MAKEKRKYTKKNKEYWESLGKTSEEVPQSSKLDALTNNTDFVPEFFGTNLLESKASRLTSPNPKTRTRQNKISTETVTSRFQNIEDGILPFEYSSDFVTVRDAVELCQKAYFNVPVFRATIDLLSEFANSEIYLEGGSVKSANFLKMWFKKIRLEDLKAQYFREHYRSGNIFFTRFDANIKKGQAKKLIDSFGASKSGSVIPIKYMLLNPADLASTATLSFDNFDYQKILASHEIARLKKPKNDHEKQLLASLPAKTRKQIRDGGVSTGTPLTLPLESDKLHIIFDKKQDYEPFAIPAGYAVLDDINKKMELKKIDQAIARSVENVILLVTMGAEPDKGGINHNNLNAMRELFKNQSVGRVLVSDYTTKADFIIPDLKKVLGKEKYEVLNADITDGLQNVLLGESKYADTELKLQIFMQRLNEARDKFLRDFLQPEISRVCKSLGMKKIPEAKFVRTDTLDNPDLQRLVVRMMELGILTPEQGIDTIKTGIFPDKEALIDAQEEFKEQREDGLYTPLVDTLNMQRLEHDKKMDKENAKTAEKIAEQGGQAPNPNQSKNKATTSGPSGGRPMGTTQANYSARKIAEATKMIGEFELRAKREFALIHNVEELDETRDEVVSQICEKIVVAKDAKDWDSTLNTILEDFEALASVEISEEIVKLAEKHELADLPAAILYHSNRISV